MNLQSKRKKEKKLLKQATIFIKNKKPSVRKGKLRFYSLRLWGVNTGVRVREQFLGIS